MFEILITFSLDWESSDYITRKHTPLPLVFIYFDFQKARGKAIPDGTTEIFCHLEKLYIFGPMKNLDLCQSVYSKSVSVLTCL